MDNIALIESFGDFKDEKGEKIMAHINESSAKQIEEICRNGNYGLRVPVSICGN